MGGIEIRGCVVVETLKLDALSRGHRGSVRSVISAYRRVICCYLPY